MFIPRDNTRRRLAAAILAVACAAPICPTFADDIVFDTNNGTFTVNGAPATSLGGTPLATTSASGGVTSFYFGGNLTFGATDVVTATGGNALSIDAGNNVTIAPGAVFNVSAQGSTGGVGGSGGGAGGAPVVGGLGGVGGIGGAQQSVSAASQFLGSNGFSALPALAGAPTGPGPLSLLNFTFEATGLAAYTGGAVGVGTFVRAGGGSFTTGPSSGPITYVGAPNSGILEMPQVPQGQLTSEAQLYFAFNAGSGNVPAQAGDVGQSGQNGNGGAPGGVGVNSQSSVATGGNGGAGGLAGSFGGAGQGNGNCSPLGNGVACGVVNGSNGQDASVFPPQGASGGSPGPNGFSGGSAGSGANGNAGGTASNLASGSAISGGNGGAGGGSGGSGGGGGGGMGGGAGGSGGNNDPIFGLDPGQTGGTGGLGGGGGTGTYGGQGGTGGGGGGAIQIVARGTLTSGGTFSADGAAGQQGEQQTAPVNAGSTGTAGTPGGGCNFLVTIPGLGCINAGTAQPGGAGGQGGSGGSGGAGGSGGMGGNGAGGTVKLEASVVNAGGSTIDASGGVATNANGSLLGGGSTGDNGGRVIIASNSPVSGTNAPTVLGVGNIQTLGTYTDTLIANINIVEGGVFIGSLPETFTFAGTTQSAVTAQANAELATLQSSFAVPNGLCAAGCTVTGSQSVAYDSFGQGVVVNGQPKVLQSANFNAVPTMQSTNGPQAANPLVKGGAATPDIPNLVGGAAAFGMLDGVGAMDAFFASLRASAPTRAAEALYRVAIGPTGYDESFTGYDTLLLINLTGQQLTNPFLGVVAGGADSAFSQQLLDGGYATDPLFGGLGPTFLDALGAYGVYETLVPAGEDDFFNFGAGGLVPEAGVQLADGQFAFAISTPEPEALTVFLVGLAGTLAARRRGRSSTSPGSAVR
jgi:hypothetical protein